MLDFCPKPKYKKMKKITVFMMLSFLVLGGMAQPFNRFLSLDGVDDYAQDNFSGTNFPSGNFTIEFWIFACEDKGFRLIDAAGSTAGGGIEMAYSHRFGRAITVTMRRSGTTYPSTSFSTSPLPSSTWNHFALTYNATDSMAHTFINGVPDDTVKIQAYTGASHRFYLGRSDHSAALQLKANLDEMRISDTIRYSGQFTPQNTEFTVDVNTEALYHFNDTTIDLLDASPNNYHLLGKTPETVPVLVSNDTSGVVNMVVSTPSVCVGDSALLTLDAASQLFDNDKWSWYSGSCGGVYIGDGDSIVVSPSVTTTYFVRGEGGCAIDGACASFTITVNPIPVVNANASALAVCSGSSVTLFGTGTATNYFWSNNAQNGISFIPAVTTTYQVIGTNGNCTNIDTITVAVNPLPTVNAIASSTSICAGDSVTLSASGNASTYTWTNNVQSGVAFLPTTTTTYQLSGTNGNCTNSDTITVVVNPLPTVNATASSTSICAGDSVTLSVSGNASTYSWTNNVQSGVAFLPTTTTTYQLSGTNGNCTNSDTITVVVNPLPTVLINSFPTDTVCLSAGPLNLPTASPLGGVFSGLGVSGSIFDPSIAGVGVHYVRYDYADMNGCVNSDSTLITVDLCTNLGDEIERKGLEIYPNPFSSELMINNLLEENFRVDILSLTGQIMHSQTISSRSNLLHTSSLKSGIYFIRISGEGFLFNKKMVKQ
jgi:hypothetical protein